MTRFAAFLAAAALAACGPAGDGVSYAPDITAAELSAEVDNPYWPLPVGARWVF